MDGKGEDIANVFFATLALVDPNHITSSLV